MGKYISYFEKDRSRLALEKSEILHECLFFLWQEMIWKRARRQQKFIGLSLCSAPLVNSERSFLHEERENPLFFAVGGAVENNRQFWNNGNGLDFLNIYDRYKNKCICWCHDFCPLLCQNSILHINLEKSHVVANMFMIFYFNKLL